MAVIDSTSGTPDSGFALTVSLSINIYIALFLGLKGALNIFLGGQDYMDPERACETKLRPGSWRQQLAERHASQKNELPRLILDTLVTIPFAVFGVVLVVVMQLSDNSQLSWLSESGQGALVSHLLLAARYIFAIHVGKYVCNTIPEMMHFSKLSRSSHLGIHLMHHSATVCCYMIVLFTGENVIFAACGLVMELDQLFHKYQYLLKKIGRPSKVRHYVKLVLARLILLIMVKFALPLSIVISSWATHTRIFTYNMSPASLAFMSIGWLFFPFYNLWLLIRCALILRKTVSDFREDGTSHVSGSGSKRSKAFFHINRTIHKLTERIMPNIPISTFNIDLKEEMKLTSVDYSPVVVASEGKSVAELKCTSHSGPCLIREAVEGHTEAPPAVLLQDVSSGDIVHLVASSSSVSSGTESKKDKPVKHCKPRRQHRFDPSNLSSISEES